MTVDRLFTIPELRRAVRICESFVGNDRAKSTPEVVESVEIYISACRLVNDRLGEADRLLSLGQRSEAIRQVQMDPDALVMFDLLCFADFKHFPRIADEAELPIPPKLNLAAAKRINESYSFEKDGEDLLQEHRTLALSRSSLKRRLEVIRLLQRAEPHAAFWQDDIAAHEQARFEEIRNTLVKPELRDDWPTLRDIHEELSSKDWQTPCPLDLVDIVKKSMGRVRREAAQNELNPVIARLKAALREEDVDAVNNQIDLAGKIQAKYKLSEESPLLQVFWEALKWVKGQMREQDEDREFAAAVKQLRGALKGGLDWTYVQEYYRVAMEFGRPLPRDVQEMFQERASGKKWPWIIVGIIVLILLAFGIVYGILQVA